jgi:hypothetical protein
MKLGCHIPLALSGERIGPKLSGPTPSVTDGETGGQAAGVAATDERNVAVLANTQSAL